MLKLELIITAMHRILQDHLMLCLQASEEKGKNGAIRKVTGYYSYYSCQTNVAGYKVQCLPRGFEFKYKDEI